MQPSGIRNSISPVAYLLILIVVLAAPLPAWSQALEKPVPRTAQELLKEVDACARAKRDFVASGGLERVSLASPNIDVIWYSLDIDLHFTPVPPNLDRSIDGVVRVDARVVDQPLDQLVLDFGTQGGMSVSSVLEDGVTPIAFLHANNTLTMALSSTVPVGGTVSVVITYSGLPRRTGFGSFVFGQLSPNLGSVQYAWTLSEPYGAREWWPCKDHPSDKADSVRVAITVPDGMMAASQGLLRSVTSNGGRTTFEWASNYPITSYLVSIAAADYVKHTNSYTRPPALAAVHGPLTLPMEHYHFNDGTSDFKKGWKDADAVFPVLEEWFGAYPFGAEKYGHAEFTFGGGMEHQTLSSMGTSALVFTVHELAHQWYGDAVSPAAWPHLWLNEGFATWAELLFIEARPDSFPPDSFNVLLRHYRNVARGARGTVVLTDTLGTNMFGDLVYNKGAMILRMLQGIVGDSTMKEIVRTYAEDPQTRYGTATTSDFQRIVARLTGDPFDAFFDQWLYSGTGHPIYRISAENGDTFTGSGVIVTLEQVQTAQDSNVPAFEMPITIAVQTQAGEERFRVMSNARWQVFKLDLQAPAQSVTLDPDRYVLSNENVTATVSRPPASPVFDSIIPNPTNGDAALRVSFPDGGDASVEWYDVAGRRVRVDHFPGRPVGPQEIQVSTGGLASGVYFVRLVRGNVVGTRKLVVVR